MKRKKMPVENYKALDTNLSNAVALKHEATTLPVSQRMHALRTCSKEIEKRRDEFAKTIVGVGIKTIREAYSEVDRSIITLNLSAEECRQATGEEVIFDQTPNGHNRIGWWSRKPLGVIVGICPYNDPLNLIAHKVGPAIAAGAPIIIKPHERTQKVAYLLQEVIDRIDIPANMVQTITCSDNELLRLVSHPDVSVVSFTGGKVAGDIIAKAAAGKKLLMELGGVCTSFVAGDTHIERTASDLCSGIIWAAGQNCVHTQIINIEKNIFSNLTSRIVSRLEQLHIGDQSDEKSDVAPLIDEAKACQVEKIIIDAIDKGASLLCGGKRYGRYITPALLSDVPEDHSLINEEIFAPVSIVRSIDNIEKMITEYKPHESMINASIFTQRLDLIMSFRQNINAGTIIVNDSTDFRIDAMPFGGNGSAGLGREGVRFSIDSYTSPQLTCLRA